MKRERERMRERGEEGGEREKMKVENGRDRLKID